LWCAPSPTIHSAHIIWCRNSVFLLWAFCWLEAFVPIIYGYCELTVFVLLIADCYLHQIAPFDEGILIDATKKFATCRALDFHQQPKMARFCLGVS
jgi:hypothetical protein